MTTDTHGLITTRGEFQDALHRAFADAAAIGCRELWLCDTDFADWPLGERAVIEQLRQWAGSQRRLTLIATTFDEVVRRHPRWVDWRRQWSHVVHCRANTEIETGAMPTVLLAPGLCSVRLSDRVHYRGRWSREAADEVLCRELIDAVSQRSEETFPATATGL
jgi:peptidyl-tRNA hydrolase